MNQERPILFFINYRWSQCYLEARDLQHSIEETFENVKVFRDEDSIEKGESLKKSVLEALEAADLVLPLLHENWLEEPKLPGKKSLKIRSEDCWIRMELDVAHHQLGKTIIPVLFGSAKLPDADELYLLPDCLHFLSSDINAQKIARDSYKPGLDALLTVLEEKFRLKRKKGLAKPKPPCLAEQGLDLPEDKMPDRKAVPAPYLGINYFEEKHTRLFFGRSDDICNLWDLVERKPQRLLLLYGYSGVGKSSLLHAGLFPRMKQKGWQVEAERRNKRNLTVLLADMLAKTPETCKILIALDQVEEALIEPSGPEAELPPLFDAVSEALDKYPGIKVVLGFRKEFLPEVQAQVVRSGLKDKTADYFLKPLEDAGLLEAIRLDKKLKDHYGFEFEPGLEEKIAASIVEQDDQVHGGEASSKAPWLQMLLLNVWETAEKRPDKAIKALIIREKDLDDARAESFQLLVKNQLSKLETEPEPHCTYTQMGLTLDLLHFLTTAGSRTTAAIKADEELFGRYDQAENKLTDHLRLLEDAQLVIRVTGRLDQPFSRLAHDALAPVIRQEFESSDKPAQRAHRIFESKKIVQKDGQVVYSPINDQEDIEILTEAREYMYRWPSGAAAAFERGAAAVREAEEKSKEKTIFIFNSFAGDGTDLIKTLDAGAALEKMKVAVEVDIDFNEKRQKLLEPLEELVYFFAEGGKRPDLARTAAQLLLKLTPDEMLRAAIKKCQDESWDKRADFSPAIDNLSCFPAFKTRYYPEMVDVKGGAFTMGSPESDPRHESDEKQHKVKLSSFRIASTPVTFYQFALFCESTGKSIASMKPSWGRFGDHPLVNISWYDAIEFCNWLSLQTPGIVPCYRIIKEKNSDPNNQVGNDFLKWRVEWNKKANGFRLPTNAEWEFAARGGLRKQKFEYAGSNVLNEVGWFRENSGDQSLSGDWAQNSVFDTNGRTHPVKEKKDNGIGLYDMSGNVWEWCWDWYDADYYDGCKKSGTIENPLGPERSSSGRVLRGGAWFNYDFSCCVASRARNYPDYRSDSVGFRPAQG